MKRKWWFVIVGIIIFVTAIILTLTNHQNEKKNTRHPTKDDNTHDNQYGVTADNPLAVETGMEILNNGGNAVDAAVAVAYMLNVVEPALGGLGGGGTLMVMEPGGKPVVYDYREMAPENGELSDDGTGVMGFVKGMETVHNDHGSFSMKSLIDPAIEKARNGFVVSETLHNRLKGASYRLNTDEIPYFNNGNAVKPGEVVKDKKMAKTLRDIKNNGSDIFYKGKIASIIHEKVPDITLNDLKNYDVIKKDPLKIEYKNQTIYLPPPADGGIMIAQALLMAENLEWDQNDQYSFVKNIGTINRLAYKDRFNHIGDPDYVDINIDGLLSDENIKNLLKKKNDNLKLNLDSKGDIEDHANTSHFTVVDEDGMMVSSTNTLSNFFGSGERLEGFFLNNGLHKFSNGDSSPNRLEGGKRPFSYISPIIVSEEGEPVLGIGSSGGRRITSVLTSILIQNLELGVPLQETIDTPRFFMELNSDIIHFEKEISQDTKKKLKDDGFEIIENHRSIYFGSVESLEVIDGYINGGADERRNGEWHSDKK